MKRLDAIIVSVIVCNFVWFGWRAYNANHVPPKTIATVSSDEMIGNVRNLAGDSNSKYIIVEFGDYQCPPCARMFGDIEEFMDQNRDKFRFQFRQFPLPNHSLSLPAALIAERARKAGKFESVHRALFALNANLDEEKLISIASQFGLRYASADSLSKEDNAFVSIISNEKLSANKIPIVATPSLFLCTPERQVYQLSDIHQANEFLK